MLKLKQTHEDLTPNLLLRKTTEAHDGLVRGNMDVAFYYEAMTHEHLEITHLGHLHARVYCGRTHPLFKKRRLTQEDVLMHSFSVPQAGDSGLVQDGWPVELPRKIGMRISMLSSNLAVCLSGQFLTVLPSVVAAEHLKTKNLRELPLNVVDPIAVYGARRKSDGENMASALVMNAVREEVQALEEKGTRNQT